MSEVILTKNRIEPGKRDRLREWMTEITTRREEAIETLRYEGMISEAAFLEQTDDADYLVYYMEAEDIDGVYEAFQSSPYEIDHEHGEVLDEVLADDQPKRDIELLYHLVNPEHR
ncbi:DUF6176 family protein [Halopelagius longus]|uniref:Uncharacterized protein n=1 Tax=Halopelagius longus TaxID=1236180 RepID=A0A1H0YBM6_9EURY|nr:DUF6176 family protein [Halopelagius longus]RDI72400.1 hypothetical protein DWB78_12120 [Halopelagius longus]SDQ12595.1 hypothetical protein SAMN05216278_0537 [Halopelagius longus]